MAEKNNYAEFITKLIEKTKNGTLRWRYLDEKEELYKAMGWTKTAFITIKTTLNFNTEDSYYVRIKNTYIVLLTGEIDDGSPFGAEITRLFVVPDTYKKCVHISEETYGEYITRLFNMVQSQFPDGETFIKDFLASDD